MSDDLGLPPRRALPADVHERLRAEVRAGTGKPPRSKHVWYAAAAAVLATGVVNLLQTLDLGHIVLGGADLLPHGELYRAAVEHAVRTQLPGADWLDVEVSLTSLGTDVVAAGAAMQVLDARYGLPDPARHRRATVS